MFNPDQPTRWLPAQARSFDLLNRRSPEGDRGQRDPNGQDWPEVLHRDAQKEMLQATSTLRARNIDRSGKLRNLRSRRRGWTILTSLTNGLQDLNRFWLKAR